MLQRKNKFHIKNRRELWVAELREQLECNSTYLAASNFLLNRIEWVKNFRNAFLCRVHFSTSVERREHKGRRSVWPIQNSQRIVQSEGIFIGNVRGIWIIEEQCGVSLFCVSCDSFEASIPFQRSCMKSNQLLCSGLGGIYCAISRT